MSDRQEHQDLADTTRHFFRGLRIVVVMIAAVVLGSLALLRHLPDYHPMWMQWAAFSTLAGITALEGILLLRQQVWGRWRWVGLALVLVADLFARASMPGTLTATSSDWAFGGVGWIALILLLDCPLVVMVAFLSLHETITLAHLLTDGGDPALLLNMIAASIGAIGYPLATGIGAIALRSAARAATEAHHEVERITNEEAAAATMRAESAKRLADLHTSTVPLLERLATGTVDFADPQVHTDCAIEAARVRRLLGELDSGPNPLATALEHCVNATERRGVLVTTVFHGTLPELPEPLCRALTERPLLVLANAKSAARVTVIATDAGVRVDAFGDHGPVDLPASGHDGVDNIINDNKPDSVWVEAQWRRT